MFSLAVAAAKLPAEASSRARPTEARSSRGATSFAIAEGLHPEVKGSGSLPRADSLTFIGAKVT